MNSSRRSIWTWIESIVPRYAWLPLIFEFALNMAVYSGAKRIAGGWVHHNIETALDRAIPFLPWMIVIYFGCYIFWIVNYILCVRQEPEHTWRFLSADFLAKLVCLFFFLAFPTTNTRPEITGHSVWEELMRFLYWIDTPDNLFPSIHCLTSWFCYIGLRGKRQVSAGYRIFSCLFAVAVFLSTLTTKQHVLADVAGGVLLAEAAWQVAGHTRLAACYGEAAQCVNRWVWGAGSRRYSHEE